MNNCIQDIFLKRRSIRKYKNEPVSAEIIKQILQAGMSAPSALNKQPWHFIVVTDKPKLNDITKIHPHASMLTLSAGCIIVLADPTEAHKNYWIQDCSAATENMLLAISSLGLGGVWLGVYSEKEREEGLRRIFDFPKNIIPISIISFGVPDEEKPSLNRYDEKKVHNNRW